MFGELLLTVGIVLITYAFYKLYTNHAQYFKERNLKYRGIRDSLGIMLSVFFGRIGVIDMTQKTYDSYPDEP